MTIIALIAAILMGEPSAKPPAVRWENLGAGVGRATIVTADGTTRLLLFRYSLTWYEAKVVLRHGPPAQLAHADVLRRKRKAVTVISAGFDKRKVPVGLRISNGVTRVSLAKTCDCGILLIGGTARIVDVKSYPPPDFVPTDAIETGLRLIVDGVGLKMRPCRSLRTAVALDRDGSAITLVVATAPVDINELAERLAAAGFDSALALGDETSAQVSIHIGDVDLEVTGRTPASDFIEIVPGPPMPGPRPDMIKEPCQAFNNCVDRRKDQ